MNHSASLCDGRIFEVNKGQSILSAAIESGVVLEYSCRTGRCGVCKVKVAKGTTEVIALEEALSGAEADEGYILTCCRAATSDIQLATEDLGGLGIVTPKILPCRIDGMQYLSEDVLEVILRTPPASRLKYLPGQYIDVIGANGLRRSYSIANSRREDGKITLHIRRVLDGLMSKYWFEEARIGDLLRFEGALGTFCLRRGCAKNLVLLATGTGVAPLKAMLEHLASDPESNSYNQIYLYWGGRFDKDIYWQPNFPQLPLFFTPVLSRENGSRGRVGYVQQAVLADSVDLSSAEVYACGSEAMIRDALELMVSAGLRRSSFYSDAFVSSN